MAVRQISVVQKAVRVVLDQNKITEQLIASNDIDTLSIDEMVRDSIPRAVRAILLVAPGVMLEDSVDGTSNSGAREVNATLVDDTELKLKSQNGDTYTYSLNSGTRLVLNSESAKMGELNSDGSVNISGFTVPAGTSVWDKTGAAPKEVVLTEDLTEYREEGGEDVVVKGIIYSSLVIDRPSVSATVPVNPGTGTIVATPTVQQIPIPANFLRLLALKFADWDYQVDHATPRGDVTYAIQHSNVYSLRGNPQRPIACVTPDGAYIEAFTSSHTVPSVFKYVAIPEISTSDTIDISDKLYPAVIYYCASLVCTSLGDFNKAAAMERLAMQYVTVNTNTNREIKTE